MPTQKHTVPLILRLISPLKSPVSWTFALFYLLLLASIQLQQYYGVYFYLFGSRWGIDFVFFITLLLSFFMLLHLVCKSKNTSFWASNDSAKSASICIAYLVFLSIISIWYDAESIQAPFLSSDIQVFFKKFFRISATLCIIPITSFAVFFLLKAVIASHYKLSKKKCSSELSTQKTGNHKLQHIKNRLEAQIAVQHAKQFLIILLFPICLFGGASFFFYYTGNSVLSEIHSAARVINKTHLSQVINQDPLDIKVSELQKLANDVKDIPPTADNPKPLTFGVASKFANPGPKEVSEMTKANPNLEVLISSLRDIKTLSDEGKANEYHDELVTIATQSAEINKKLTEYQPIDWESVAIRVAYLALLIIIIRLLFATYKQTSKKTSKLQDQLLACEIALTSSIEDLPAIGNLFSSLVNDLPTESTPESPHEALISLLGKSNIKMDSWKNTN